MPDWHERVAKPFKVWESNPKAKTYLLDKDQELKTHPGTVMLWWSICQVSGVTRGHGWFEGDDASAGVALRWSACYFVVGPSLFQLLM